MPWWCWLLASFLCRVHLWTLPCFILPLCRLPVGLLPWGAPGLPSLPSVSLPMPIVSHRDALQAWRGEICSPVGSTSRGGA